MIAGGSGRARYTRQSLAAFPVGVGLQAGVPSQPSTNGFLEGALTEAVA